MTGTERCSGPLWKEKHVVTIRSYVAIHIVCNRTWAVRGDRSGDRVKAAGGEIEDGQHGALGLPEGRMRQMGRMGR